MSNESMQQLLALRAQLQQLELEEAAKAKVSEQPAADDSAKGIDEGLIPEDLKGWLGELEGLDGEQLLARIRDEADRWLGEVDADLKDANPSTLLLVFGLGVLVGRLSQ